MTLDSDMQLAGRKVEVSPDALARICPEARSAEPGRPARARGLAGVNLRRRVRLFWTRVRFRFDDFRTIRLFATTCRLRGRLIWMRVRHRGRLSK